MAKILHMPRRESMENNPFLDPDAPAFMKEFYIKEAKSRPPRFAYDIENEAMLMTKQLYERFQDNPHGAELCFLYLFYYYTAKWQKTNQAYATNRYVAKGMNGWSLSRVRRYKRELADMGLIKTVEKWIDGTPRYFVKVMFYAKQKTIKKAAGKHRNHRGK